MRWDPWTGLARLGSGGRPESGPALSDGAARAAAATLLQDHGALWGADRVELVQVRWRNSGPAWHATWEQHLDGGPLRGAFLDLTLGADGHLVAFRSTLLPNLRVSRHHLGLDVARRACETLVGSSLSIEASEEIVAVRPLQRYEAFAALELTLRSPLGARWRAMVDAATGSVAALESLVRTEYVEGTTTGTIKPLYEHDPLVNATFPWLLVRLGDPSSADSTASDGAGSFALSANPGAAQLEATLAGLYVTVDNEAPRGTSPRFSTVVAVPGTAAVHLTSDHARDDERSIYVHANIIHDYARRRFGFSQLDYPVPAVASVRNPSSGEPNYSNAFWDGQRMGFGVGGSGNFGLFADVVYHEYTHAITDVLYRPVGGLRGTIGAAIHEALSDYFACTLTDEPRVGEYLGGLAGFRNLDNELVWPEDRHPGDEEHANGEILGGALWHVRTAVGAEVADRVIHFARELFPQTFDEYLEAILLEDDLLYGDGAPGNGSPHREAILAAFGRHGIGPLVEQEIRIVHTALHDTEDAATARRVSARNGSRVVEGMRLHWSTGGDWTVESMQADPAGGFTALLPGQADGTMVSYYLTAYRTRPYEEQRLPATAPAAVFSYRVGVDHEAPHLEHAPLVEVPAFGWPAELHVRLQDNLGVAYAYAEVWRGGQALGTVGLVPMSGDPDLYLGRFPNVGGAVGERFEYVLTAVDASQAGNSTRFPAQGRLEFVVVQDLLDDFERGAGSWRHRAVVLARPDPWQLTGAFNHGDGAGHAWLCGAESGELPAMTAAELQSDWLRLGNGGHASIWSWMQAEENGPAFAFDGGVVQIQREGVSLWELLTPVGGYDHEMSDTGGTNVIPAGTPCLSGRDTGWRQLHFDLSPWSGQRVRLRFLFGSDNVPSPFGLRGWLLDDFELQPGPREPTDAASPEFRGRSLLVRAPWPNPFRPSLRFELQVPRNAGHVVLEILDARGRLVTRLLDEEPGPGARVVVWRPQDLRRRLPAGVYGYRLVSRLGKEAGKLVLLQ